jgi:hypothetical protein
MITLLAYAPDERWAFARVDGRVVLVRPPFQQDLAASDAEVERAVTIHGFLALTRDFPTRRALLDFLGDESVRVWNARGAPPYLDALRRDLLASFTEADLDRQIARAQKKLDAREYDVALLLLTRLLTADALTRAQRDTIAGTQERAQAGRREQEDQRRRAVPRDRFQRANRANPAAGALPDQSAALRPAA